MKVSHITTDDECDGLILNTSLFSGVVDGETVALTFTIGDGGTAVIYRSTDGGEYENIFSSDSSGIYVDSPTLGVEINYKLVSTSTGGIPQPDLFAGPFTL